eukprot:s2639_g2.t1
MKFTVSCRVSFNHLQPTFRQSRHLLAGGGAACAAVCTLHPLDVIKTRLMAQTRREYYTGVLDCVQKICRDEGPRGLYRGISVSLCSTTPSIAISFTAFDEFKRLFAATALGPDEPDNFRLTLCSGACAGSLASTLMFPMDLVRRQMQMVGVGGRPLVYANVGQAIYHVFQTGFRRNRGTALGFLLGLREFFRGLAPELLKVAPHNAIMFSTQHHLISRKWYLWRVENKQTTYAKQLSQYEQEIMIRRLSELSEDEIDALCEEVGIANDDVEAALQGDDKIKALSKKEQILELFRTTEMKTSMDPRAGLPMFK